MERHNLQNHRVETVAYTLFALLALGMAAFLCHFKPVVYTRLVNEDQWGEYGTFVGFAASGAVLVVLASRPGPLLRRILWALIGLTALFIAGEEIAWGQRILNYSIPDLFHRMNTQDELNLHNFAALDALNRAGLLRLAASFLILGWASLSLLVCLFAPNLGQRLETQGLPLIPLRLLLPFLLVPYLFIARPLVRSDEIGELFFAMALAAWAVDLALRNALPAKRSSVRALLIMAGVFLAGTLATAALARKYPGSLKGALESMAAQRYPGKGMYDQADQIYRYIYGHPRLLRPDTRIQHAKMLLALERRDEAVKILNDALSELEKGPKSPDRRGQFLMRRGTVRAMLGKNELAEADFEEAVEFDLRQAEQASDPDKKAVSLWAVARTLKARGDHAGAVQVARQAGKEALSGKLQRKLEEWISFLEDPEAAHSQLQL